MSILIFIQSYFVTVPPTILSGVVRPQIPRGGKISSSIASKISLTLDRSQQTSKSVWTTSSLLSGLHTRWFRKTFNVWFRIFSTCLQSFILIQYPRSPEPYLWHWLPIFGRSSIETKTNLLHTLFYCFYDVKPTYSL